jgi:hypothetical protein
MGQTTTILHFSYPINQTSTTIAVADRERTHTGLGLNHMQKPWNTLRPRAYLQPFYPLNPTTETDTNLLTFYFSVFP